MLDSSHQRQRSINSAVAVSLNDNVLIMNCIGRGKACPNRSWTGSGVRMQIHAITKLMSIFSCIIHDWFCWQILVGEF